MDHAIKSGFTHAFGRLIGTARANLLFDPATDVGVNVLPVLESMLQYRAAHATQQATVYLVDQFGAFLVIEYLAHQRARLAKVIVLGVQFGRRYAPYRRPSPGRLPSCQCYRPSCDHCCWGHILLYAVALIGLPLTGWYWSSVADKPIMVAGLLALPPMVTPDENLYDLAKAIHTNLSWFCGALVGGHILIALKHHFINR